MAAPSAYTEGTLAEFMVDQLGEVAGVLEWHGILQLQEPVNDALLLYGAADAEDATDIPKLRAIARYTAWRAAVASLVARYDFTNPEGSYSRSQMLAGARQALADAERDVVEFGVAVSVAYIDGVDRPEDPYTLRRHEWAAP